MNFLGGTSPLKAQDNWMWHYVGVCNLHYKFYNNVCLMCKKRYPDSDHFVKVCTNCDDNFVYCIETGCKNSNTHKLHLCSECGKLDVCYKCGKYLGSGDAGITDRRKLEESYTITVQLPSEGMTIFNNGREALKNKDFEEALKDFRKLDEMIPNDESIATNIGVALRGLNRDEEALTYFDKAINLKPGWPDSYAEKGITLSVTGRLNEAGPILKKAIDLGYNESAVFFLYGKFLREVQKQPADAIPYYEKVIAMNPNVSFVLYIDIGDIYYDLEKYDESIKAFQNYLQHKENDFYALSMIGDNNNMKNNFEEALKYLMQCYDMHTGQKEKELNTQLGISYCGLKQYDKAEEHFKKSLSLDPNYQYALVQLGEMYYNQGRTEDAVKIFLISNNLDPNYKVVNTFLGNCYLRLNQLDNAEPIFKKLLSIDPKHTDNLGVLADIYFRQGKYNDAITYYEKFIPTNPVDVLSDYYDLGRAQYQVNKYQEAKGSFEKLIEKDVDKNPEPFVFIALCELKLNNPAEAEKWCDKSLESIKNDSYFVYYNASCIYSLRNKVDKSLDLLEKALKTGQVDIPHMESDTDLIKQIDIKNYWLNTNRN
jgi:tetratricopeptide (TPR) repeat protein